MSRFVCGWCGALFGAARTQEPSHGTCPRCAALGFAALDAMAGPCISVPLSPRGKEVAHG